MKKTVRIGITLGDVNGIGPEVALKAAYGHRWPPNLQLILIGSEAILRQQRRAYRLPMPSPWTDNPPRPAGTPPKEGISFLFPSSGGVAEGRGGSSNTVVYWDPTPKEQPAWAPGKIRVSASRAAAGWIRAAVDACLDGSLDGMVTGPICKEGFHRAGMPVPGHTELLARMTRTKKFAMMLFGGPLKVILVTRHVPLSKVAGRLTKNSVVGAIALAGDALPWFGCKRRRIGVCGLNPHAGEGGDIGREEITRIEPAIQACRKMGYDVRGPIPADVVFYQAVHGQFEAVVAMYHDQGLGPLKTLEFDGGVNVTLGLPIVRTSPDHGTAFDIAGRGIARPSSMVEAIRWAARLAARNNPWKP